MDKKSCIVLFLLTLSLSVANVSAQKAFEGGLFENFGVAVKGGMEGLGFDVSTSLHPNVKVRLGYNYFGLNYTSGLEYSATGVPSGNDITVEVGKAEINFSNVNLLFDYFPMRSGIFHLTGGLYCGKDRVSVYGSAPENFYINDDLLKPIAGNFKGDLILGGSVKPYFGIGLGRTITKSPIGVKLEIGVLCRGAFKLESDNIDTSNLMEKQDNVEVPKLLNFWPMMTLSLSYRIK